MRFNETSLVTTFDFLVGMAFHRTCLAVLVLLLVFLLRKTIRPQVRYLLLLLAVLRLALPMAPASGLSLFNARPHTWLTFESAEESVHVRNSRPESPVVLPGTKTDPQAILKSTAVEVSDSSAKPQTEDPVESDPIASIASEDVRQMPPRGSQKAIASQTPYPWKSVLLVISGLGTALILIRALVAMGRLKAILTRATDNAILQACANRLLDELKIRWPIRVVTSPDCNQPGLYGFLKPVVILPPWCNELSTTDIRLLLRHELTHLHRFDHWVFRFTQAVAALHWWNPIVRRTLTQLRRECELACDQTVLKVLSAEERARYGHLLLEVAERQIVNRSAFTALAFSPSATTLRERIDQSQNFTQTTRRSRVAAAVFVFAIAVLGLTDGRPQAAMTHELSMVTTPDEPRVVATTNQARVAAIVTAAPAPEVVNLKGRYVDQDDKPVAKTYVGVYCGRSTAEPVIRIAEGGTDEDGRFHIRGTLPELLRESSASPLKLVAVFWKRGGIATVMRDWEGEAIDDNLIVATNTKVKQIRGRVIDHLGKPVQGATVSLPNRLYAAIPTSHYGLTNVEGEFEIPSLPAELETTTLWVAHPTFGQTDIAFDAEAPLLTINISEAGKIEGKVVDSETQLPVPACVVMAWSKDKKKFAEVLTNADGDYQLRVLPDEYTLTVVAGKAKVDHDQSLTVQAGNVFNVATIKIRDDRASIPESNLFQVSLNKKPDRVAEAAAESRKYKFLPSSDPVETEARRLLSVLKKQQDDGKSGSVEWAMTMRSLIQQGSAAVPILSEELDKTDQKDRLMLRSLPFILRGIGDTRAVPALIRAIPRCFGGDGSDMGYRCEDAELLRFMQQHDSTTHHEGMGPDNNYSWGRPVSEVFPTLQQLTGREEGAFTLAFVSAQKNERHNVLGQRLYNQVGQEWAAFWKENGSQFLSDEKYLIVDVIPVPTGELPPPPRRDVPLRHDSGEGNGKLGSVLSPSGRYVFRDLDTGLNGDLPEQFLDLNREQRIEQMDEIVAWARLYGFDLMGTEVEQDGVWTYVLRAIDMEIWEISKDDFDGTDSMDAITLRGREVDEIIGHFDITTQRYDYPAAAYFCFVTNNGIQGKMLLGVPVTSTNLIAGFSDHTKDEFQHAGMYLGRRYALKWLKPAE